MLTAPAKASAAPACGLSHTWTESFWPAATVPVARVRLVNGTALPGEPGPPLGVGEALANPLAPTIVVPMIAAVAPVAAISDLVLDIAPCLCCGCAPSGRPDMAIPGPVLPRKRSGKS